MRRVTDAAPERTGARLRGRHVRQELAFAILAAGKCVQEASDVDLIAGEVAADGMGINGKAH